MSTKPWEKPLLVELYRGRPEESVLQNCKTAAGGVTSGVSLTEVNDCVHVSVTGAPCSSNCVDAVAS